MLFVATLLLYLVSAAYDHTIDCDSFSKPKGWTIENSCDLEGDFGDIVRRPLPQWYADMKFGIFIHWGIYSVPAYGSEWYWHNVECGNQEVKDFQDRVYGPGWKYEQFLPMFKAELYNASEWVRIFQDAGAQYVLPVGKHHDGFCMWNASTTSPGWNAAEAGPKRDVLNDLYEAVLETDNISFGIYFSQGEWFDSKMVADSRANFTQTTFLEKMKAQRLDMVTRFPEAIIWHTDGGWFAPDNYWGNREWLEYVYDQSPLAAHVVTCNSLGFGCCAKYPGSDKCFEYGDAPSGGDRTTAGEVVPHFYTNQMTIQKSSWSWDRSENNLDSFFNATGLISELVSTAAWNGTLVMNIGPRADGTIPPIFQERLAQVGAWLRVNGEAIYSTRPWPGALPSGADCDGSVFYTMSKDAKTVYATIVGDRYPDGGKLILSKYKNQAQAELLGTKGKLSATQTKEGLEVLLPSQPPAGSYSAWVVKLTR